MIVLEVVARYVEAADSIVTRVYVVDKDANVRIPNRVLNAQARLVNNADGGVLVRVDFDRRMGNQDGSVKIVLVRPPQAQNVSVEVVLDIADTDPPLHLERIVPVVPDAQPNTNNAIPLAAQPDSNEESLSFRAKSRLNEVLVGN